MDDSKTSRLDLWLERFSKVGVPIAIALVGGLYTLQKDNNDTALRIEQRKRDEGLRIEQQKRSDDQRAFDNTQKQYANLTALLPYLASERAAQVRVGLEIYISEAHALQAPTDLQQFISGLADKFPAQAGIVQAATEAGRRQDRLICTATVDGIYLQVANSTAQLALGRKLADQLTAAKISPAVQGVQRIDRGPNSTELRYYFGKDTDSQADGIIKDLRNLGLGDVVKVDLSGRYLKPGCQPPAIYELWIGASNPLAER